MKAITKNKNYRLKKLIAGKTEIAADGGRNTKILSKIKNNTMEEVCAKLKSDLKWYKNDVPNNSLMQTELLFKEDIIHKEFLGKTASKLVEEWWLSS